MVGWFEGFDCRAGWDEVIEKNPSSISIIGVHILYFCVIPYNARGILGNDEFCD